MTTLLPPQNCPKCHHILDAHTTVDREPRAPLPEDVTVCINCGAILIFDDQLVPQIITKEQLADFKANGGDLKQLHDTQEAVKYYKETHKL